jgi:hypothetical protein
VVGCKSDLTSDREVNSDKGQELAIRLGAQYYECSAKSGENVDNIFHGISNSILGHQVFFIGAGAMFDWLFFDNSKLINFDD